MGDGMVADCDLSDASLDFSCEMGDVTLNSKNMGSSYVTHGRGASSNRTLKATSEKATSPSATSCPKALAQVNGHLNKSLARFFPVRMIRVMPACVGVRR